MKRIFANKKFWIIITLIVTLFMVTVIGQNLLHAVKIKRQINLLEREREYYQEKITQDSILVEQLRYDDYIERYAREVYRMQAKDEDVYIME